MIFTPVAKIYNDFPTKFGLPRQSGMAEHLTSRIVMEPQFRNSDAFRGIEEFEYLWLIWVFEPMGKRSWSPTVRPPKLGGNKRMGVFATRSPNRPNPIGLTRVKLLSVEKNNRDGVFLKVSGADLMNGTEILDIKPYLPFADSAPCAATGNYGIDRQKLLEVEIPADIADKFTAEQLETLKEVLAFDPRPGYQDNPNREYGFNYCSFDIRFTVDGERLTVKDAIKLILIPDKK
ncbi:MAG TPA: tRNA (N6-threonylcarbamoyladenosine(37)-N6)-methyltransferase TrmO [Ruminococcaceae bacterium]|nr:tRNA (N6-threonylcarbamoyladenosine(37)-N6)-methyltransferase TrmO [Oscillospiraceae bacterium]